MIAAMMRMSVGMNMMNTIMVTTTVTGVVATIMSMAIATAISKAHTRNIYSKVNSKRLAIRRAKWSKDSD